MTDQADPALQSLIRRELSQGPMCPSRLINTLILKEKLGISDDLTTCDRDKVLEALENLDFTQGYSFDIREQLWRMMSSGKLRLTCERQLVLITDQ